MWWLRPDRLILVRMTLHLLSLLVAVTGCTPKSSITCGEGTRLEDGVCVPDDATGDSGAVDTAGGDDSDDSGETGASDSGADTDAPDTDEPPDTGTPVGDDGWPARFFAPFVDASAYPIQKLGDISDATGVLHYQLGFIVDATGSACDASRGTYYTVEVGPSSWGSGEEFLYDELARVRAAGGDVLASFGGAANTPLASSCGDVASLTAQYRRVVDALSLTHIDFDVEGYWVADAASIERRALAAAALQAERAAEGLPLSIWLTLPVLPTGLTPDGVAVVEAMRDAGVALAGVNIMTMDYGDGAAPDPDGQMGAYAIQALESLHGQLGVVYAAEGLSDAALWARTGVTPMIGLNDVMTETFYLSDAEELLGFAQKKGVGQLSMWSMNRDHPCPDQTWVGLDCSSTPDQTSDYQFSAIFADME